MLPFPQSSAAVTTSNLNEGVSAILVKCKQLRHLKQLQAFLIAAGHSQTHFFTFKLLRFCVLALSDLCYARSIFDGSHSPNVYLYTAMITAFAADPRHFPSALCLFRRMIRSGSPMPNHFIYPHVLKACDGAFATSSVHAQVMKCGFGRYPVVETALVDSYARTRDSLRNAREVFDEMYERTVVSWTAMVSGYARIGRIDEAMRLFEVMPERDVPSWNALIAGCTQNGLFPEAMDLFWRMLSVSEGEQRDTKRPNQVTVVCALSACGHTGMLELGKGIHGYVLRNGLGLDSFISNALVDMYGKCGSLTEARLIFDRGCKKSLTAWNSMINCFALHGQTKSAIGMFEEMLLTAGDAVTPDGVTFIGLLNACTHGGLVEIGRHYFEMMSVYGVEPRIEHYGCIIDLLGRAGQFDEALAVIGDMKISPDEVIWGSLLNGCKIHGRLDLAEFALEKLLELEPNNGGYRAMLANAYGELGKWDDVRRVRKMLKEQDAHKTPGCSWVEVNNRLHQFYSLDLSHFRSVEIYAMLDSLAAVT
ncbi:hypothetical protein MLD38_024584 [Melastoma candidum]|uniref:Uncharacterized protein n=1 Tax=Melastoma candidum TaxID=119954 RepID=A0ACB9NW62_9MYRT|nr:hypothetical protein MLD38_024584 [Melastoma candidum]